MTARPISLHGRSSCGRDGQGSSPPPQCLARAFSPPARSRRRWRDTVYLGAAVSLTGKYTTAGEHTQHGCDLAVKAINDASGITVAGESYRLEIIHCDDESTPRAGSTTCRKTYQPGRRGVHARPLQLGADQGDRAGHRAVRRAHGGGQRSLAAALQQGLPLPLRDAVHHRAVPGERRGSGGRARRKPEARPGHAQARRSLRERPLQPGHPRRHPRGRGEARHPGRGRRPASARAQRHGGDVRQGEGGETRPPRRLGAFQGGRARHQADRGDAGSTCQCWPSRIATAPT